MANSSRLNQTTKASSQKATATATASPTSESNCQNFITYTVKNGPGKVVGIILTFVLSHLLHHLLKPFAQPRISSDIAIGLVVGSVPWIREAVDENFITTLNFVAEFGMICYMFALGMEMDPYMIFKPPTQPAMIAYAGMLSSFLIACSITPFIQYFREGNKDICLSLSLSITLSGSGSHILTRIITNLKIGKSDIGKLVIGAGVHSDMVSLLVISIGYVVLAPLANGTDVSKRITSAAQMGIALLLQTLFAAKISPIFLNWVNNENPEGKPMKGSHLVLSIAFMVMVCSASPLYGYSPILSAFMAGIFLPSEGRVSKWAVGTIICGAMLGYHWRESVELGLLLSAKGHFHLYLAIMLNAVKMSTSDMATTMVIVIFYTVVFAPSIVMRIIQRARKLAPTHRRTLQWLDPSTELRILLCVHGRHNVPATINFMEISRGTGDPGILVHVTDMVELTEQIAATLVQSDGIDTVTVTDKEVTEMRDQITHEIEAYVDNNRDGITVRRMLALSSFNGMAQDICLLAEDLMVSLIVLPFHKKQLPDGTLDGGHPGFRYVNRKMLRSAPCSVGILVDRRLGTEEKISTTSRNFLVAVIFIGGKDDREALAYAGCVARHPGVKLTVIRFLLDDNSENMSRRAGQYRVNQAEQEAEMKLDDEAFAHFYERHVAGGYVSYMEKHLANSAETYSTLRSLEGQYALVIVGRGGRVNSILTVGMNDWQQCPELGPIGDVLSGSSFSQNTSVLVIQQHLSKGELEGMDDEFSIM
ncbi:cation/hydrogen exchanger 28 [Euphorbia peplus]|nr:cation/hydrogen exchanger 28 [Euphorbia peplus]